MARTGMIATVRGDGRLVVIDAHEHQVSTDRANGAGAACGAAARASEEIGYEEASRHAPVHARRGRVGIKSHSVRGCDEQWRPIPKEALRTIAQLATGNDGPIGGLPM